MNLRHAKPVGQDADFFHLHDTRDNKPFKVAKKGLGKGLHDAIVQHFADGGDVAAPEEMAAQPAPGALSLSPEEKAQYLRIYGRVPQSEGQIDALMRNANSVAQVSPAQSSGILPAPTIRPTDQTVSEVPSSPADDTASAMGLASPSPTPTVTAAAPPSPAAPKPAPPKTHTAAPVTSPEDDEIAANFNQKKEAAQALADMERNRYAALQANQETSNKRQQDIWTQAQAGLRANLDAQNKLMNDISNQKLDFNGYWANKSAPAQITAAIGMILGGIGSGMTMGRQGNMAADVINKAIERDVEQQKAELGKKQNMLSHLMEQGHSLREATTLAMAHDSAVAEGQMKAVADKYAGLETAPILQGTAADLMNERVQKTIATHQAKADLALKSIQMRKEQMEMALMGKREALIPIQMEMEKHIAMGGGFAPDDPHSMLIEPKLKITTDVGGQPVVRRAADEKGAEKIREAQKATGEFRAALGRLTQFRASNPMGTSMGTAANTEAKRLTDAALVQLHSISDITKMSPDITKRYENMLSDAGGTALSGTTKTKFDTSMKVLNDLAQDKLDSTYGAYLDGGGGVKRGINGRLPGQ